MLFQDSAFCLHYDAGRGREVFGSSRVPGLLRVLARGSVPFDERLVYTESQFVEVLEHGHPGDKMEPRDLACEIALPLAAQDAGQTVNA